MTSVRQKSGILPFEGCLGVDGRLFVRRGMSIKYLLPNSVIKYIEIHRLYLKSEPVKSILSDDGA